MGITTISAAISSLNQPTTKLRGKFMVDTGEPGDSALIGVLTLEGMGLMVDPFKRKLRPMRLMLA